MGFASESGYTPSTIESILTEIMGGINTQFGTTYTYETFIGTNFYKYFYALAQELQKDEVKTSELFLRLQDYLALTTERISRPVVTNPGLIEKFLSEGFIASVKKPIDADAGKLFICVDTDETADDYSDVKLAICELIKNSSVAGVVTQGAQVETITLSNGQDFDFKFNLPNRIEVLLRLTNTVSDNNQVVIPSPEEVKQVLIDNIEARYQLGRDFEPQRYYGVVDAPWTSDVLLEWSDDDGATWQSTVYDAAYDDLFTILLENITLVEA